MHPLWGSIKKVERAYEQFDALDAEIEAFVKTDLYGISVGERNPKTGNYPLRAITSSEVSPPLRWSVLIGEIAHNLRSALDHIACQLALTSYPASDALFHATSFPIFLHGPRSNLPPRYKWTDGKTALRYIKPRHRTVLQGFQPYSRRDRDRPWPYPTKIAEPRHHPLWQLHEINNADKHRLLQVTARVARGFSLFVTAAPPGFVFNGVKSKMGAPLKNGAYLGSLDIGGGSLDDVDMNLRLYPEVVFWDGCQTVKGLPVRATFERILFETKYRVLVPLAKEFPPMETPFGPPE
jgi:hypothetical protein